MSQSEVLFARAQKTIPGGVNSPVRAFKAVGGTPRFITKADGPYIYDVDGNRYIDYIQSWGPMVLGHNNEKIREAVIAASYNGLSYGAPLKPRSSWQNWSAAWCLPWKWCEWSILAPKRQCQLFD